VVPLAARLVRDFVNTFEPQLDAESLTTPERLRAWFAERQLIPPDAMMRPADLATAVTVREGLRSVLLGHGGHPTDPTALERLDLALALCPYGWPSPPPPPARDSWPSVLGPTRPARTAEPRGAAAEPHRTEPPASYRRSDTFRASRSRPGVDGDRLPEGGVRRLSGAALRKSLR
jgi:hypothetical protein